MTSKDSATNPSYNATAIKQMECIQPPPPHADMIAFQGHANAIMFRHAAEIREIKRFPNGLRKLRLVDADGLVISEWVDGKNAGPIERAFRLHQVGRALYGERWQTDLARALGVGDRRVREWASGTHSPPAGVWNDIANLLSNRQQEIATLLCDLGGSVHETTI